MKKDCFTFLEKTGKPLYIVAVSGGPDSTFLLYKMHHLGYRIVAAHLNYGKRYDSFWDEELVIGHCEKLSVKLFITRIDGYEKGNFQATARNLRYSFFSRLAEEFSRRGFKIGGIVVAHNFEDLLETYQLQKERKSLVKYWGLPFRSQFDKWLVFRPVISFERETIIRFLNQEKIRYASDYTNDSTVYRRNVVRKRVFALSREEKELLSKQIERENILLLESTRETSRKLRILFSGNSLDIGHRE